MLARVSNIEAWRRWREDPDATPDDLIRYITVDEPSEAMLAGTAFHAAMETLAPGEYDTLQANGYTFRLDFDSALYLPTIRELRCSAMYGPLEVSGQVDGIEGRRVDDHKTTANLNVEKYIEGCQWRFYLDIFDADVFRWNVFPIKPVKDAPKTYTVSEPHLIEMCRYKALHDDCMRMAAGFYQFATTHMKEAA